MEFKPEATQTACVLGSWGKYRVRSEPLSPVLFTVKCWFVPKANILHKLWPEISIVRQTQIRALTTKIILKNFTYILIDDKWFGIIKCLISTKLNVSIEKHRLLSQDDSKTSVANIFTLIHALVYISYVQMECRNISALLDRYFNLL